MKPRSDWRSSSCSSVKGGVVPGMRRDATPGYRARGMSEERAGRFDRFVEAAHDQVSNAWFFTACVAAVVVWLVSFPLFTDAKAWQVTIHTVTSVTTLLLVALLENASRRDANAAQEKLNTIAGALADLMDSRASDDPELRDRAAELREAVGLEDRASSD
jgi:hypothetical protein